MAKPFLLHLTLSEFATNNLVKVILTGDVSQLKPSCQNIQMSNSLNFDDFFGSNVV